MTSGSISYLKSFSSSSPGRSLRLLRHLLTYFWSALPTLPILVHHADFVLLTAPALVASSIHFDPPLSTLKRHAMRTVSYSAATKVLMAFETSFWDRENKFMGGSILTDLHIRQVYYPQKGMNSNSTLHVAVASYTWGRDAGRFDGMSHSSIINECLKVVSTTKAVGGLYE